MAMESTALAPSPKSSYRRQKSTCSPIQYCENRELDRIDGEPLKFKWTTFQGVTALQILAEIPKMMNEMQCEPQQFTGRIIFISMYNEMSW